MKTRYALAILALALPIAAFVDRDARADAPLYASAGTVPHAFFLNQWGGVNYCRNATEPHDVAWCADTVKDVRLYPDAFDCDLKEVDAEYDFCAIKARR